MFRSTIVMIILNALFIGACRLGIPSTPPKNQLPTLEGNWTIRLTQSGGIMGLSRSIEIHSDGKYATINDRTGTEMNGQLSNEQITAIMKQVAAAEYSPITGPEQYTCADCFIYKLEIDSSTKFSIQLNDTRLPGSGLESLVNTLRDMMENKLK